LTAYASSKIDFEQFLESISDDNFTTAYLRNSTAFGYAPVFRIDLVVNNLLACALTKGTIDIKSDGEPWRPLLHCSDIAGAFMPFITAPAEAINRQAVNIGANDLNFQVKEIAAMVKEFVPGARINFTGEVGEDPRDYRVSFDKLNSMFPAYQPAYTLRSGIAEMKTKLEAFHFSEEDFDGNIFTRLRLLKKNIHLLESDAVSK
jgi:nucleoside-diphosphate-sugar epimerase